MSQISVQRARLVTRAALGTVLAIAAGACSSPTITLAPATPPTPSGGPTATTFATPSPTPLPTFARNPAPIVEGAPYVQTIDPAMFGDAVDHPFFPMVAGSTFTYGGDEHVEVKVLAERKTILGVQATVVSDKVFVDGELAEDTLDWYAQDRQGNVWYFGEQTAEYEDGKVTSTAGSWEAGVEGAQPGIIMLADPRVGDTYRQEFSAGEAEDLAEVTAISGEISSRAGSWSGTDVFVTEEWTPLEPKIRERKTYARGVGLIETVMIKGGREKTTLSEFHIGSAAAADSAAAAAPAGLLPLGLLVASRRRPPGVRSRLARARGRHEG